MRLPPALPPTTCMLSNNFLTIIASIAIVIVASNIVILAIDHLMWMLRSMMP